MSLIGDSEFLRDAFPLSEAAPSPSTDDSPSRAGQQRTPGPAALMAPALPGQVPGVHQHFGRRRSDGSGRQSAADPGDAHGDGEGPGLEEDR